MPYLWCRGLTTPRESQMTVPTVVRTLSGAHEFMNTFDLIAQEGEEEFTCVHGHRACSVLEGGPCMDETLANFPEARSTEDAGR